MAPVSASTNDWIMPPASVVQLELREIDTAAIAACARDFGPPDACVDDIIDRARVQAAELPRQLRSFVENFRLTEHAGAALIRGIPIGASYLGPTPTSLSGLDPTRTAEADRSLALVASLLGDLFGWAAEYDGRLIHDLVPLRGHETEQSGVSSNTELGWHTDESYHPYRCDYLALLCLRNPDHVPTGISVLDVAELSVEHRERLFCPRFAVASETAHAGDQRQEISVIPVLFGPPDDPYLRFDEGYTDLSTASDGDRAAFEELSRVFGSDRSVSIAMEPGDLLLVDNYRSVHARGAFQARFDGTDRWIKRTYITRDLRKSRTSRSTPSARVVS